MSIKVTSNIRRPGTDFSVIDGMNNTSLLTGSKGVISYVLGSDHGCPNVLFQNCVVSRRGKGGKDRMEQVSLISPLINVNCLPMDILIPDHDKYKQLVTIESNFDSVDLDHMSVNGYINWLFANLLFVRELANVKLNKNSKLPMKLPINQDRMIRLWRIDDGNELIMSFMENIVNLFESGGDEDLKYIYNNYINHNSALTSMLRELYHRTTLVNIEYRTKTMALEISALEYIMKVVASKKESLKGVDVDDLFGKLKDKKELIKTMKSSLDKKLDRKLSMFSKNMSNYAKNKEKIMGLKVNKPMMATATFDL
jgi:hypothetical protein